MPQIHPTAIVAPGAMLAEDVVIGPYCIIGEHVTLGPRVTLRSHVVVDGRTTIGEGTRIFPFASIGLEPQDLKYRGETSALVIGRNNTIREYVTMNPGTDGRRHGHPDRRQLPVHGRRPRRPRLPDRRPRHHGQQRDSRAATSSSRITPFSAGSARSTSTSGSAGTR